MPKSFGWRTALATAAAAAVVVAAPLTGVQVAHAQDPYPPDAPEIGLSATTVSPGDRLFFRAEGFEPGQRVTAWLLSKQVRLGVFHADENGEVTGVVTIPRRVEPGWHTFELRAQDPDLTLSADLFVRLCHRDHHCRGNGGHEPPSRERDRDERESGESDRGVSARDAGGAAAMVAVGGGALLGARRLKNR